ncbi:transcription factor [Mycena metata]|uniref:Transcription factor n=1 Tax=Mycena metata TaxID=1033252 RepID=A0AAD7H7X7_9AGAR|nr:transcription factor [Mycena metata]
MVLISSKKYACETCIKGHRSSACKHTDRPLFEIKKKGRPVTQCEHCRELRKTKQVHVKCICEAKEPLPPPSPTKKKGTPTLPAHAAFPHGVPDSTQSTSTPSNNSNSDSEHGGMPARASDPPSESMLNTTQDPRQWAAAVKP